MDGAVGVAAAAQVPVVVLGRARLVVRDHLAVQVRRGRGGLGAAAGPRTAPEAAASGASHPGRGSPLGERLAQAEAQEPVVAGLADAVRTELGPALEVVGPAGRVAGAAPQAGEGRAERHGDRA